MAMCEWTNKLRKSDYTLRGFRFEEQECGPNAFTKVTSECPKCGHLMIKKNSDGFRSNVDPAIDG